MTTLGRYLERHELVADLDHWRATLALDPATLARRALAGDHVARVVESLSARVRWFELVGDAEDDPPPELVALDARKARRRSWRHRRPPRVTL